VSNYVKAVCAILEHLCAASSTATGRSSDEESYHVGSINRSKIRSRVSNAGIPELSGLKSALRTERTEVRTTNRVYCRLYGVAVAAIVPSSPDSGIYSGKCVWREMSGAAKSAIG